MRGRLLAAAMLASAVLSPTAAHAACTALGLVTCSVTVVAGSMSFGNYNPTAINPVDVSSTVSVTGILTGIGLLTTLSYDLSLSAGSSGTVAARKMSGPGGATLAFNLYSDSSRTSIWGTGTVSDSYSALATVLGSSYTRNYTMYGRLPAQQYVAPGAYSSTITVTVAF